MKAWKFTDIGIKPAFLTGVSTCSARLTLLSIPNPLDEATLRDDGSNLHLPMCVLEQLPSDPGIVDLRCYLHDLTSDAELVRAFEPLMDQCLAGPRATRLNPQ